MRQFALGFVVVLAGVGSVAGQKAVPPRTSAPAGVSAPGPALAIALTPAQQEAFLSTAKVTKTKEAKKGVTGTLMATLADGTTTHQASIQTIDQSMMRFESSRGVELNFRDYWGYNVAAYRLAVMLGLDMIPPAVARRHGDKPAAFTWWVDDVLMDELGRVKSKTRPPDITYWGAQNALILVFDALIGNVDRNQGNMLIDKQWKVWMIDHSRAFRLAEKVKNLAVIRRCERTMFARLKALDAAALKAELDDYLTRYEMDALLERRDAIVAHIEALGPAALYDLVRPTRPGAPNTR